MPLIAWIILVPVAALMAIDYVVVPTPMPEPIIQVQVPSLSEPEVLGSGLNAYPAPAKVTTPSVPTSQPVAKPVEKKKKKGGTKDKSDDFINPYYVPPTSTMTLTPFKPSKSTPITPVTPHTPYGSVDPDIKASCQKISKQCMANIQYQVGSLSGSAYYSAVKAYGNICNEQYRRCLK